MENCYFKKLSRCSALTVKECPVNCKFAKTRDEFEAANKAAELALSKKGLTPFVRSVPYSKYKIMSTAPISYKGGGT